MKQKNKRNAATVSAEKDILMRVLEKLLEAPAFTNPAEAYMANMGALKAANGESPATHEQWAQLYEVAGVIKKLAPWRYLHESQLITLLLPGRDEPVYIVVMGNGEITYGVGVYAGYDALHRLRKMTETELDEANISAAFEQHCINLYFGDREELEPKDKNVIKELGLKFRGKNQWPHFRSMKPGFLPWHISYCEAELTIAALQNFVMAFLAYAKDGLEVDFESNETLLRFYDSESDTWYNTALEMPVAPFIRPRMTISDDVLMARLKKKKRNKSRIGFALTYLPMPVQENKNQRPAIPRLALLADMSSGMIIDKAMDTDHEAIVAAAAKMLTGYVEEYGRPVSISISDEEAASYVENFTEKLGIQLVEDEKFSAIGNLLMGIMGLGGM